MKSWRCLLFGWLPVLGTMQSAVAQLEQHTQTYDLTLDDCLASTFRQYPEIQRLRVDVERALGTKTIFRSRALPQLSAQVEIGLRGGNLYNSGQAGTNTTTRGVTTNNATALYPTPFSTLAADLSQPLIDLGIPPALRRGRLEVVIAQQNLNREVTDRLYEARTTFLRALYLRDLIALHEDIDQRLQANVQSEQQRLDVGTGSEAALKSAKIQELNLQLELSNLRGEYFAVGTRITELCGLNLCEDTKGARQLWLPRPGRRPAVHARDGGPTAGIRVRAGEPRGPEVAAGAGGRHGGGPADGAGGLLPVCVACRFSAASSRRIIC